MYQVGQDDGHLVNVNMCIYSWPGGGKTVLWGSGNEHVAILESDPEGVQAARSQGFTPHVIPVTDYDDLIAAYEYVKHDMPKEHPEVSWVTWDSLTLFQDRALIDDVLMDAAAANPKQSEDVASMREYLINMNRIGKYVRMFVDLPINFGVSCHVMPDVTPDGEIIYMPAVQGKGMPSKIAGYMNVVGYLGIKADGTRRLLTETQEHYFAKDRFHALRTGSKGYIDDPTLPKIQKLVNASRKASGSPARRSTRSKAAK